MKIIDSKTLDFVEFLSVPMLKRINKYYVALIIKARNSDGTYQALLGIIEQSEDDDVAVLRDAVSFEMGPHLNYDHVALAGVGDESALYDGLCESIVTMDCSDSKKVVIAHYELDDWDC